MTSFRPAPASSVPQATASRHVSHEPCDPGPAPSTTAAAAGSAREIAARARQIRRLVRRVERAELVAELGPARAARARLKRPARITREALQAVRRYGAAAKRDTGVSRSAQLARIWWLDFRHGISGDSCYHYELFLPGRRKIAPAFTQSKEARLIYRLASIHAALAATETLSDKRRFAEWCEREGVPTVPNLMHFENGEVRRGDPTGGDLPAETVFAKWAARLGGGETLRLRYEDGAYVDSTGRRLSPRALVADLAERSREAPVVLQRCMTNHPDFAGLAPSALSTVRVMTARRPGRRPTLLLAVLRMGANGALVDNWTHGGITSPVDPRSGRIGTAVRLDDDLRPIRFDVHPDTGAPIPGFQIPFWHESVALAVEAHARLGDSPCVGWDVAVLPSGPVLLEGNWNPGVKLAQVPGGIPLLATEFAHAVCELLADGLDTLDDATLREWSRWEPAATRGARYQGPDLRAPRP